MKNIFFFERTGVGRDLYDFEGCVIIALVRSEKVL